MGKYSDITHEGRAFLLRIADAYKTRNVTTWLHLPAGGDADLEASDGQGQENLENVPISESFYAGLGAKEFLSLARTSEGYLQLSVQKPTLDYADYTAGNRLTRWREDVRYDLAEEKTVWAKLAWIILGFVLGFLSARLSC